ncbi:MAG: thiamine pyrophosphate-dependent enzyme [Elusimicrobia bacterium]|nr:thiamine pyrophosphate-dependent enzyme [Elusimicrobiota bacterium]
MANLKELCKKEDLFTGGHRLCAGCGAGIIARQAMLAASDKPVVVTSATGCLEVASTIFPYTAWKVPFFHSAFENSAATCSGIESAYRSLKKQGKIKDDIRFIAFGGDGGTYDIGLQSLSGAVERRHRLLYICYNNEAYMNTGIQRSGATPKGAHTTTAPAGKVKMGKEQFRKDLTAIMAAHDIPYVAQAVVGNWNDFVTKVQKALETDGPSFINILQPCRLGWGYPPEETMSIGRLAVETCMWPIYEVVNGQYKINSKPKEKKPVAEFMKKQSRFKHLFKPENQAILDSIQAEVDQKWNKLLKLESLSNEK